MAHRVKKMWIRLVHETHTEGHPVHTAATGRLYQELRRTRRPGWIEDHRLMLKRAVMRLEKLRQLAVEDW